VVTGPINAFAIVNYKTDTSFNSQPVVYHSRCLAPQQPLPRYKPLF